MEVGWRASPGASFLAVYTFTWPLRFLPLPLTAQCWHVLHDAQGREAFWSPSANWFHTAMFRFCPYSFATRGSSRHPKMRPAGFAQKEALDSRVVRWKLLLAGLAWPEDTGVLHRGLWETVRGRDAAQECLQPGVREWAFQEGLKNVGSGPGPASFNVLSNCLISLYQCLGMFKALDWGQACWEKLAAG